MRVKLEHTSERLTRRSGLILVNKFNNRIDLPIQIDKEFPEPGSNRGKRASEYVMPLIEMFIDGAIHLEDIKLFENDLAYKELTGVNSYPTSDAIGDWLRRHGNNEGEQKILRVNSEQVKKTLTNDEVLDIDSSLIEADKGDAMMSYKGYRGYNPLLGIIIDKGIFICSRFQQGNVSPQSGLVSFINDSQQYSNGKIKRVRIDSAGYNHEVINHCFRNNLQFTITADQDVSVIESVKKIPKNSWKKRIDTESGEVEYEFSETIHTLNKSDESFRLVIKRTKRKQINMFEGENKYWIIATNISKDEKTAEEVIDFHNQRGEMERLIGELKHHFNLDRLPCGQLSANSLYFTIGILSFNIVQLLKRNYFGEEWKRKSVKSLRYYWFHLPAKVIHRARYIVAKISTPYEIYKQIEATYLRVCLEPAPA